MKLENTFLSVQVKERRYILRLFNCMIGEKGN